ncbi:MAG: VWA-like domain-containing protein [Rhodospirillales bacterium]|nr:VWA-like domain-containing protein [Rhodospirillales bacterium]
MADRAHRESAERVSRCVTALLREQPFFGSLALRLPIRADAGRETLASDGREIRYAPDWVAETDAHAVETAIARVVLACALKHHTRRGERDPERWQRASQLVTHGLLRDAGFTLPPDAEAWDGISVEQAYDRLPEPEPDESGDDGDPSPGGGDAGGAGEDDGSPNGGNGDGDDGSAETDAGPQPDDAGRDGDGDASSGYDPAGTGEVMDAPTGGAGGENGNGDDGPSARDIAAEEQAWDEVMHQAASLAKAEGKMPGAVEETVRGAHASAVDWRTLLRRFMTDAAKRDYSWSVPNRRFIDSGLYLPSIRSEGIDAIAVIVDTSGSLDPDTLAAFWSEVREVAAEIEPERVVLLQVDTAVRDAAEYAAGDLPDEIVVRGRGGTDFRPGFAWLEEHDVQPGVCLYLTDMECSRYPEAEPQFDVIWVNHGDPPGDWNRQPWGERIDIAASS